MLMASPSSHLMCLEPRILQASEHFDRGFYSGPFGWISGRSAEFVVAIRSALVTPAAAPALPSAANGNGTAAVAPVHDAYLYAGALAREPLFCIA